MTPGAYQLRTEDPSAHSDRAFLSAGRAGAIFRAPARNGPFRQVSSISADQP